MVFSLAACTTQNPTAAPTTAPTAKPTEKATSKPTDTPTEAPTEPAEEKGVLPLTTEKKTIRIGIQESTNVENYDTNAYTLWLEEQTGVELEFVYFSSNANDRNVQLNAMIASSTEKLPDILVGMGLTATMRNELGKDGYLLDLNEYFEKYAYWYWEGYDLLHEDAKEMIFTQAKDPSDGALYVIPGCTDATGWDNFECPAVINKAWLEKLNLKMPETVAELHDVLVAFRDGDPNGNGKSDEIPMTGGSNKWADIVEFVINAYVFCNDAYRWNVTDGKIWSPYTTPEYREALKTLSQWYSEGLLSATFFSNKASKDERALIAPAEGPTLVGVGCGHPSILFTNASAPVVEEFTALKPLKAETSLGGYIPNQDYTYTNNCFITTDAEDPVLCFKFLDFMSGMESFGRQRWGVYGEDWEYAPEAKWTVNVEGSKATMILYNDIWAKQGNHCWQNLAPKMWPVEAGFQPISEAGWDARERLGMSIQEAMDAVGRPKEVVYNLVYTDDEAAVRADYNTPAFDYVEEARAGFIVGNIDPNKDSDWNTYLQTLEAMNFGELQKVAQSAYDRMYGK